MPRLSLELLINVADVIIAEQGFLGFFFRVIISAPAATTRTATGPI